jgi:hypothetical protein
MRVTYGGGGGRGQLLVLALPSDRLRAVAQKKPRVPKIRRRWLIRPTERVKPSDKAYSRKKLPRPAPEE